MAKELHEYTLKEIQEETAGDLLLAIGRGEYRSTLYQALNFAVMVGHARGKKVGYEEAERDAELRVMDASGLRP